jgi:hypothetical protein
VNQNALQGMVQTQAHVYVVSVFVRETLSSQQSKNPSTEILDLRAEIGQGFYL